MNKVYRNNQATAPLTPEEIKELEGECYDMDRIKGEHCNCAPDTGVFVLLAEDHPTVLEGGKRYMVCRNCGCYSHL